MGRIRRTNQKSEFKIKFRKRFSHDFEVVSFNFRDDIFCVGTEQLRRIGFYCRWLIFLNVFDCAVFDMAVKMQNEMTWGAWSVLHEVKLKSKTILSMLDAPTFSHNENIFVRIMSYLSLSPLSHLCNVRKQNLQAMRPIKLTVGPFPPRTKTINKQNVRRAFIVYHLSISIGANCYDLRLLSG